MKVYVASKSRHWPWWCALRSAGIAITSSWIDAPFNHTGGEPPDWGLHWQKCIDEASAADVVLCFAQEGENQNGALIEVGAALARGRSVFLIAPYAWSWAHHPQVRRFDTLAAAVEAIAAMTSSSLPTPGRRRSAQSRTFAATSRSSRLQGGGTP